MTYDNDNIQIITGTSLDDCKKKLFSLYKTDYTIVDKKVDDIPCGPFKLLKRPGVVVKYIVNHDMYRNLQARQTEQQKFEESRQQILKQQDNLLLAAQFNNKLEELKDVLTKEMSSMKSNAGEKHENIKRIEELLQENEFSFDYIEMISNKIRSAFSLEQLEDFNLIQRYVVDWIGETIEVRKEKVFRPPHVVIIVGPTGIGKTSTLVKLVGRAIMDAKSKNKERPKYCVITIDNIRAGSFEQVEKMIKSIDEETPVKQALTSEDVKEIYDEYKNHVDYIFIDSAGCSPNDAQHIGLMKNILSVNMNADVYLGVTASTKASDLKNIIRNYEPFGYDSIIVTKNDESNQFGNIISVLHDMHKTISYITNGQFVKNIKKANVVDILMNLTGFDIDRVHIENKFGIDD